MPFVLGDSKSWQRERERARERERDREREREREKDELCLVVLRKTDSTTSMVN